METIKIYNSNTNSSKNSSIIRMKNDSMNHIFSDVRNGQRKYAKYTNAELTANKQALFEKNLGLVTNCVKRFLNGNLSADDLFIQGSIGLQKAVDSYDPSRGVQFSAFAIPQINGEMIKAVHDDPETIRIPAGVREIERKLFRAMACKGEDAQFYDEEDWAEELGVSVSAINYILNERISYNDEDGMRIKLDDCGVGTTEDQDAFERENQNRVQRLEIDRCMNKYLTSNERMAVSLKFGLDGEELSNKEIAERMEVSSVRVGQLLKSGCEKLHGSLRPVA